MEEDFAFSFVCGVEMAHSRPILTLGVELREKAAVLLFKLDQVRDLHFNLTRLCNEIEFAGASEKQREDRRNQIFFAQKRLHDRTPDFVLQFPEARIIARGTNAIFELRDETGHVLLMAVDAIMINELPEAMANSIPIMEGKMQTSNRIH